MRHLTVLHWAALLGYADLKQAIFTQFIKLTTDLYGEESLHNLPSKAQGMWLFLAIGCDQLDQVKQFIKTFPNLNYQDLLGDNSNRSILGHAAHFNALQTCNWLIEHFEPCRNMYGTDIFGATPLHYAAKIGSAELIYALAPFCDANIRAVRTNHANYTGNALETAIHWRNSPAVAALVEKSNVTPNNIEAPNISPTSFALRHKRFTSLIYLANTLTLPPLVLNEI